MVCFCLVLVHPMQFDCLLVFVSNRFVAFDSFEFASLALTFTEYVVRYTVGPAASGVLSPTNTRLMGFAT